MAFTSAILLFVVFFVTSTIFCTATTKISFDGRSFFVNGNRTLLLSGSIHYPRLSQSEWPQVFALAKEQGINIIQTYVFWDIHEPAPGQYYFPNDGSSENIVKFIQDAKDAGLLINLRIGPYVCAEWNYGMVILQH